MATAFQINAFQLDAFQISIDVTTTLAATEINTDTGEFYAVTAGSTGAGTGTAHANVSIEEVVNQLNVPVSVRES